MKNILRKTGCFAAFLLLANVAFADMEKKMHEGKEHGESYGEGMTPCSMGHEMMMEKMGKMDTMKGDEKGCMSCEKIKMILKKEKDLELTEDQTAKIRALSVECTKNNIKWQSEIDLLKIDKKEMLMKDEVDLNEVKKIINKIHELKSAVDLGCIETGIKTRELLTDTQKDKLKEMKKKMMEKE